MNSKHRTRSFSDNRRRSAETFLPAGSLSVAGETLWYLSDGDALLFLGFSPPDAPGMRLPAELRRRLRSGRPERTPEPPEVQPGAGRSEGGSGLPQQLEQQLGEYFAGERREFDLPLRLLGTPFQRGIWEALLTVPCGKTATYGRLAAAAGRPGAVRAAGSAVGRNPVSIIVPCHRIVPAAGGVGNYGGGAERKRRLLEIEGALPV
jgi:O-6-methylguanine DNA methyltransferase